MKADLGIGDTAFGLLQGLSFALLCVSLGLPLAALSDRGWRIALLRGGAATWSVIG